MCVCARVRLHDFSHIAPQLVFLARTQARPRPLARQTMLVANLVRRVLSVARIRAEWHRICAFAIVQRKACQRIVKEFLDLIHALVEETSPAKIMDM